MPPLSLSDFALSPERFPPGYYLLSCRSFRVFAPSRFRVLFGLLSLLFPLSGCLPDQVIRPSGHRVINPTPLFRDVAAAAGIRFREGHGGRSPLNIRETIGTGCGFLDVDGDGWLDLFLVGEGGCALYRNRGPGAVPAFEDVTAGSGVPGPGTWTGCAAGDIDGDGRPDLVITGYRCLRLLRNEGGMKFRDITAGAGLAAGGWSTSAGFADFDGDGRLDLFIARYLSFGPGDRQLCQIGTEPGTGKTVRGACGPELYDPQFGSLYRNLAGGHFQDVTRQSGM